MSKAAVRAVIFDFAGTTIDFGSCAPAGAFVEVFARHGVAATIAEARAPMGLQKRDHIAAMAAAPGLAARWQTVHGAPFAEADLDRLYAEFIPLQIEVLPRFGDLIPGTLDAVAALRRAGVRIGATTGYNRAMLAIVLRDAARQGFVPDAAFCAEDVAAGRPAPWMLFRCLEALGAYPPSAVVAVGDTVPDIAAGRNGGLLTVGVAATGNETGLSRADLEALPAAEREARVAAARETLRRAGADHVIDGVADLAAVLGI